MKESVAVSENKWGEIKETRERKTEKCGKLMLDLSFEVLWKLADGHVKSLGLTTTITIRRQGEATFEVERFLISKHVLGYKSVFIDVVKDL